MIKRGEEKGGITVFAALSFMLIAQLLFVLAEAGRQKEMIKIAEMNTDSVVESMMAQYCRPLWDTYHLLAFDAGGSGNEIDTEEMTDYLITLTDSNFAVGENPLLTGTNLLRMKASEVDFPAYTLLTDDSGNVYAKTVSAYMKENLAYESAKKVYNYYEAVKNLQEKNHYDSGAVNKAVSSLKKLTGGDSQTVTPSPSAEYGTGNYGRQVSPAPSSDTGTASETNLITEVAKKQASGVLKLVLSSDSDVSDSKIKLSQTVSKRTLTKGLSSESYDISWYDKVLLQQYLVTYLSDYSDPAEDSALVYEIEYLLGGKSSDEANLKTAVTELLAVREAANMAYIASNSEMQTEITEVAAAIGGAAMNPAVYLVIKTGLIAAWAFCESILDVRALLAGRRITLMKSSGTWTSSLENLPALLDGSTMAKDCSGGLSYSDYLGILLFSKSTSTLAMRAMDIQELAIQKQDYYSDFQMDHCICSVEAKISYLYDPLFFSFINLISINQNEFAIIEKSKMSYLTQTG